MSLKVGDLVLAYRWGNDHGLYRVERLTPKRAYVDPTPVLKSDTKLPGAKAIDGNKNRYIDLENWRGPIDFTVCDEETYMKAIEEAKPRYAHIAEMANTLSAVKENTEAYLRSVLKGEV